MCASVSVFHIKTDTTRMSISAVPTDICKFLGLGPLWALCFYHFRCTMPSVPAAAPFASVSACHTTFMELIISPQRPTTCPLFSIQSVAVFLSPEPGSPHTFSRNIFLEWQIVLQSLSMSVSVSVSVSVMSVMSTHPFLSILSALFSLFACWLFVFFARLPS